jgi:hypothetical protein
MKSSFTEINLRFIDAHGDCFDVNGPFSSAADARMSLHTKPEDAVAWVIERTKRHAPDTGRRDVNTILQRGGCEQALSLGGWMN